MSKSKRNGETWPRYDVKPKSNGVPLVYIANVGLHDYSAACKWTPLGREGIRKVTSGDIDRRNPERLVWNVVNSLKHFKHDDYFVFSGSPIPFALGMSYLFMKFDSVKVLYFLKSKNEYFPIEYTREMFVQAEEMDGFFSGDTVNGF